MVWAWLFNQLMLTGAAPGLARMLSERLLRAV